MSSVLRMQVYTDAASVSFAPAPMPMQPPVKGGGIDTTTVVPYMAYVSQGQGLTPPLLWQASGNSTWYHKPFGDVTAEQRTSGHTAYRALAITHGGQGGPLHNVQVWVEQPSNASLKISTGEPSEEYALHGVLSPLVLGNLANNGTSYFVVWMERKVTAGASAKAYDKAVLHFTAEDANHVTWTADVVIYFTLLSGNVSSVSMTGVRDADVLTLPGDRYTVNTYNAEGVLKDPPSSSVWAMVTVPYGPDPYQDSVTGVQTLSRVSEGTYRWTFQPSTVGQYLVAFDCGGELQYARYLEVSAVVG